jgi:DNA-directed RNA polymerase subunit RPC12/RpoP
MILPITDVTIVRRCADCSTEFGAMTVKKDNMRLMTSELTWCDNCGAETREIRDIAERAATVTAEQASYPGNPPVADVSSAEFRRRRSAGIRT